jgi:uncharacterized membrane protein
MTDQTSKERARRRHRRAKHGRARFLRRLRNYFLTGVIVTAPIGITVYVAWIVVDLADSRITPLIPAKYSPETYLPFGIPGLGLVILFLLLTLVGFLSVNFLGRTVVRFGERVLGRMPVIRSVYGALKQIFETVLAQSSSSFREVVLVEYPRRGIWAIGLVTSVTKGQVQNMTEDDVVNIFLPTTPNPTSGFLLFVPRKDLMTLDMTVEEGLKMVVSGGLVTPVDRRPIEVQATPKIPSRSLESAAAGRPEHLQPVPDPQSNAAEGSVGTAPPARSRSST